jgi:hypothetical protein
VAGGRDDFSFLFDVDVDSKLVFEHSDSRPASFKYLSGKTPDGPSVETPDGLGGKTVGRFV